VALRRLPRRALLRGAAGGLLALPLLALTNGPAQGSKYPTRLVIFFSPNGTVHDAWRPLETADGFALGPILSPLAPHQQKLLVLDGVDEESSYHGPGDQSHWNGMGQLLTGTELVEQSPGVVWGGGVSVDQFLAATVGGDTQLASLELGVEESAANVAGRISYAGPAKPVPPETSPHKAFERVFGVTTAEQRSKRHHVLDAVHADLTALGKRLPAGDRQKLEAHAEAVRGIEHQLDALGNARSCGIASYVDKDQVDAAATFPAIGRVQMDLLVAALACDLTRVASMQWSCAVSMTAMPWIGVSEAHHDLSHASVDDAAAQAKLVAINTYYAGELAYLLAKMDSVPEGDGTLLDHSVVLWCNEIADGPTHSRRQMPLVLAGSAGGYFKTGRALKYGGAAAGHVHNGLLISLCHAMGAAVESFGNPAYCHGPLPYLTG
jgi:hypothetical protein